MEGFATVLAGFAQCGGLVSPDAPVNISNVKSIFELLAATQGIVMLRDI
jgi:hypothetical protein